MPLTVAIVLRLFLIQEKHTRASLSAYAQYFIEEACNDGNLDLYQDGIELQIWDYLTVHPERGGASFHSLVDLFLKTLVPTAMISTCTRDTENNAEVGFPTYIAALKLILPLEFALGNVLIRLFVFLFACYFVYILSSHACLSVFCLLKCIFHRSQQLCRCDTSGSGSHGVLDQRYAIITSSFDVVLCTTYP